VAGVLGEPENAAAVGAVIRQDRAMADGAGTSGEHDLSAALTRLLPGPVLQGQRAHRRRTGGNRRRRVHRLEPAAHREQERTTADQRPGPRPAGHRHGPCGKGVTRTREPGDRDGFRRSCAPRRVPGPVQPSASVSDASQDKLANAAPDGDPDATQQQHARPEVWLMRTERVPGQAARHQHASDPACEGEGPGTPLLQPLPHDVIMQRLPSAADLVRGPAEPLRR
jgi:hypothetical protein